MDHINFPQIKKLIQDKGSYGALPDIFKEIYLSNKAPQNQTITIPNLNKPKLAISWQGDTLIKDKDDVLEESTGKVLKVAGKAHPQKIEKVCEEYYNDDGSSKKRIHSDIYNCLETVHRNKIN